MKKIENPEVRDYLIKFMINQTQQCELFTKVFGKDFARKKLATNLQTVYTNEYSRMRGGYHPHNEPSITLCTLNKNETRVSVDSIETDKQKLTTMIHEAIHAMLTKTREECKKNNLRYATGILERYEDVNELGRGANEGLTNWICELLGYESYSYTYETSFIKQLELAVGKTRILKIGKGNIGKNISRQLHMNKDKTKAFLAQIDEVYNENEKIRQYDEYIYYLEKHANWKQLSDEERQETTSEFEKLRNHPVIKSVRSSEEYKMILKATENPLDYELGYFETLKEESQNQLKKFVANVESAIFDQYFKKKFQKIIKSNNFSNEEFELFQNLSELMLTDINDEKVRGYSSYQFLTEFEDLSKKCFEYIRSKAKRYYRQGDLTFDNFQKTIIETMSIGEEELNIIISDMAGMLSPEQKEDFSILFSYLLDNRQLYSAKHYSILNVYKNGQRVPIIMKDGKPQCSCRLRKAKQLQQNEKSEDFVNVTFCLDENYNTIINDFNTLRNNVLSSDPKATIIIVDTTIFVKYSNNKHKIYVITDNSILPADNVKNIKVQFQDDRAIMLAKNKARAFRANQKVDTSSYAEGKKCPKKTTQYKKSKMEKEGAFK